MANDPSVRLRRTSGGCRDNNVRTSPWLSVYEWIVGVCAHFPDRLVIVQIPEEIEDSNPPAYSDFGPPDYEEAFDIFAKSINLNIYQVV